MQTGKVNEQYLEMLRKYCNEMKDFDVELEE